VHAAYTIGVAACTMRWSSNLTPDRGAFHR